MGFKTVTKTYSDGDKTIGIVNYDMSLKHIPTANQPWVYLYVFYPWLTKVYSDGDETVGIANY